MKKYGFDVCIYIIAIILFVSLSCAKKESEQQSQEKSLPASSAGMVKERKAEEKADVAMEESEDKARKDNDGLTGHFLAPMKMALGRLLEYRVNLTYRSNDLLKSRQELLNITAKYGFISNSRSSTEGQYAYMTSSIYIKSEMLYDALKDFEKLGLLLSEDINVVDHTENMVLNERKVKREEIRIIRKNRATGQVTAQSKNWMDIENSIASSENQLDTSEHEKWKIKDKVAWAGIHIYLKGNENPDYIKVPKYSNALIGVVNLLLKLLYAIIWLLPFIIIAGIILWYRKRIMEFFSRKKNE